MCYRIFSNCKLHFKELFFYHTFQREPVVKKTKTTESSRKLTNKSGETYWELERNKRVTVREFRGKLYVDIREFYEKNNDILPGKKGKVIIEFLFIN